MTIEQRLEAVSGEIQVYNEFRAQLIELREHNEKITFDYETPAGNKDARSYIYKLRQTKSAVDKARKKEKQASLDYGKKVDSEAKEIVSEIESMIEIHQKPLDEIEQREKDRIAKHEESISEINRAAIRGTLPGDHELSADELQSLLTSIENISIDDSWEEFLAIAAKAKELANE